MNIATAILAKGEDSAIAVITPDSALTYSELRQHVTRMARSLLAHGHAKGDRIGIFSENSAFFVASYLGIFRAGLVAVPLQSELSPDALGRMVIESGMSRLCLSKRLLRRARPWLTKTKVPLLTEDDFEKLATPERDVYAAS